VSSPQHIESGDFESASGLGGSQKRTSHIAPHQVAISSYSSNVEAWLTVLSLATSFDLESVIALGKESCSGVTRLRLLYRER
jgi:hypothetical protein